MILIKRLFLLSNIYRPALDDVNEYLQPQWHLNYKNDDELILELNGTYVLTLENTKNEKWRNFINGTANFTLGLDHNFLKEEEKVDHFIFYKNYLCGFERQIRSYCKEQLRFLWDVEIESHSIICKKGNSREEILICDAGYRDAVEGQVAFDLFIPKKCFREKPKKIQTISSNNTLTLKINVKDLVSGEANKYLTSGIKFNHNDVVLVDKQGGNINLKFIFTSEDELEIDVPVYYLTDETVLDFTT